ncbi:MAG: hypothetical protein WCG05_04960 [Alphaproteobacteria bacterium]
MSKLFPKFRLLPLAFTAVIALSSPTKSFAAHAAHHESGESLLEKTKVAAVHLFVTREYFPQLKSWG